MFSIFFSISSWLVLGFSCVAFAEQEDVDSICSSDGSVGTTSSSCLLQSSFNSQALKDNLASMGIARPDRISRRAHEEEVSLFEMGSSVNSRVEMVSGMLYRSQARCRQTRAHQIFMSRNAHGLEKHLLQLVEAFATSRPKAKVKLMQSRPKVMTKARERSKPTEPETEAKDVSKHAITDETENTDNEVSDDPTAASAHKVALSEYSEAEVADTATAAPTKQDELKTKEAEDLRKLADTFIESQSGSDDTCHSKLFEAKHQLNQLKDILSTLVTQVNATEEALILYDKTLQEKLRELQEIEMWKAEELKKCEAKKEADQKMFMTLSEELKEMHQIASPATAMNLANQTVSKQASQTKLSFLQEQVDGMKQKLSLLQEDTSLRNPREAANIVPALVQSTHDSARNFLACVDEKSSSLLEEEEMQKLKKGPQVVIPDKPKAPKDLNKNETYETSQGKASSPEKCKEAKEALEKTYAKAYVELSRLVAEYSELNRSTACEDGINSAYEERAPPMQESAEKLSKNSEETADELKELRPHLEQASEADKKLRKQVADLTSECEDLPKAISDLDKVRDALQALSLCPGLERPDFKMPKWIGKWVQVSQNAKVQDDKQQDAGMNWACNREMEGSRTAESSEILERTVLDMPTNNTGEFPLIGGCPNCAGGDDESFKSGHARICWFRGQPLNEQGVNGECATGKRVIMCVSDAVSIRKIAGEQ